MKSFLNEFKAFAMRGSVLDLAVGVIIGAAFGKIVSSAVTDVLMPPIGILIGKVNFSDLYWNLSGTEYPSLQAAQAAGAATVNYGLFLNNIIGFVITALVIFVLIKQINRFSKPAEPKKPAKKPEDVVLLTEIRDLLKRK